MPKFLLPEQVEQVLDHCDRASIAGRRDYAILLLLARLGLRAGEVMALTLEDIDWNTAGSAYVAKGSADSCSSSRPMWGEPSASI
ncbi:MAG: tyrosine-type recombinase/integrase [Chromatiales bacterium]|nr:tyrosine-type recombinase/integrase [Chromatiales bacterium]